MSKRSPNRRATRTARAGAGAPRSASPASASKHGRLFLAAALAAILTLAGIVYLTQSGPDETTSAGGAADGLPPLSSADPGIAHVHGLGINPADGVLYAATHYGLFRLPEDGEATRVANRYQDTMGFTVVGPNTFLGSGHPDSREDHPPQLGLIQSTDAGLTWEALSLRGEADFHALHAAHGSVYGYEAGSGAFMVSTDREQWETRSELPMRDFAVSPVEADTVLATTADGLARSVDGGRTWQAVTGAPTIVVLAWAGADSLYGVAPDGGVHHSTDGGSRWAERGSTEGQPEAISVDGRAGEEILYVAVAERGVLQSRDGGQTFTTLFAA